MEVEKSRPEKGSMRLDEDSMERSKSFVTALQELKNLRPQLYSAADYCEKSYLLSEQKQMVLDNLKDYAVRALVNAIDHLGTVAYKLSDILEQQNLDISSTELKVKCVNQQLLTCQTYMMKEGLRQQQLLAIIPRHHKHYIYQLDSLNKKVHFNPHIQTGPRQPIQTRLRVYPSGASAANTLSWHLASETKSTLKGSASGSISSEESKTYGKSSAAFNLLDVEDNSQMKFAPASRVAQRDALEGSRAMTPHRSFDNLTQREIIRPPVRSKSILSAFFTKQKTPKLKSKCMIPWAHHNQVHLVIRCFI